MSSLTGLILMVPDESNLEIHLLLSRLSEACYQRGIPILIGVAKGYLEALVDVDDELNFIGEAINIAARLAFSSQNQGCLYHTSYYLYSKDSIRKGPFHPSNGLKVTVSGKVHDDPFECFSLSEPEISVLDDVVLSTIPSIEISEVQSLNAVAFAYDLPRFSDGDRNILSNRFRGIVDSIQSMKGRGDLPSDSQFFFSPGGDGGVVVISIRPDRAVAIAEMLAKILEIEDDNRDPEIAIKSRLGVHYGRVYLYENAQRQIRPTGKVCFTADRIASDKCARERGGVIFSGALRGGLLQGSQVRFDSEFEELPASEDDFLKNVKRYVRRNSIEKKNS